MRAIRLVYPMMKAQKWGRIVNTIGGAGKEPDPYMFGSGMTNSALLNLTKSLSTEFGEDNVLVNAICPGWVDTNFWKRNAEGLKQELGATVGGRGAQARGAEELARPHGQARGAGQRNGVSLLGACELHHRRVAQSRRRTAEGPVVGAHGLTSATFGAGHRRLEGDRPRHGASRFTRATTALVRMSASFSRAFQLHSRSIGRAFCRSPGKQTLVGFFQPGSGNPNVGDGGT